MTRDVKWLFDPVINSENDLCFFFFFSVHLMNTVFVILEQIGAASVEMNSIDFPLCSFGSSLCEGYYLIRWEEGSVRYRQTEARLTSATRVEY